MKKIKIIMLLPLLVAFLSCKAETKKETAFVTPSENVNPTKEHYI